MDLEESFLKEILTAIENNTLTLPSLPEVALKIKETAEDPDVSVKKMTDVIGQDAALTGRILRVANSPFMRGRVEIESLKSAITRLGLNYVRNLATGFAMEQIFQATDETIDEWMRKVWTHSTKVAAISHVLAAKFTALPSDQATLAGLLHEIGILPILACAEETPELLENKEVLDRVIEKVHPKLGKSILEMWDFPPAICDVPMNYQIINTEEASKKSPTLSDCVQVANLKLYTGTDHPFSQLDWNTVPSLKRLGIDTSQENFMENLDEQVNQALQMMA